MKISGCNDYFPMTKGAVLLVAVLLAFILLAFTVYLWYDLKLHRIDKLLEHLPIN